MPKSIKSIVACLLATIAANHRAMAASNAVLPLVDFASPEAASHFVPSSAQVVVTRNGTNSGIDVLANLGPDGYPGVEVGASPAPWDLSVFGHVQSRITNTGKTKVTVVLRVDNDYADGVEPWNCGVVDLKPGETGTAVVIFGYSWGKPGYRLKTNVIPRIKLFVGKSDDVRSFRIETLEAAGHAGEKMPVDPESVRTKPINGYLLGKGLAIDAAKQIAASGAQAEIVGGALKLSFPAGAQGAVATFKPVIGRWDLSDMLEVRLTVHNTGSETVTPRAHLESNGGPSDVIVAAPIAPGTQAEIVIPFAAKTPWNDKSPNSPRFFSDAVAALTIAVEGADRARSLVVESITCNAPVAQLPEWLGKRPPVEGNWTQTFEDNFDGPTLDTTKWNVATENYWDKRTHFSKDNVILKGGFAYLHYDKKTGHANDDPLQKSTDYACGFLNSYGKWVQRYGYFETRVKLPNAPGMWPAFWMMPDRGAGNGTDWVRGSTEVDGMEFDILEQLTRWGPHRYNIANHWDGYAEKHKTIGHDVVYAATDKDGFMVAGLLWTPGSVIYYCNGKEVGRMENPRIGSTPSYLIYDMVTGGWDNNDIDDSKLPVDLVIDYVRCWQRADLASPADGPQAKPARPAPTK